MKSPIHEGYEYQDYFTVSIILQLILQQIDAEITIDRKDFNGDKFDDLKVKMFNDITEFQIKYSDDDKSHKLVKDDFSNGNGHDTAFNDLFLSWKKRKKIEKDIKIKLCLAWDRPSKDDQISTFLKSIQDQSLPFATSAFKFDGDLFWPDGELPPKSWKKFNWAIQSGVITREDFLSFCRALTIFLELPKASLNLNDPGDIEHVIIMQTEKLGVGIYPNNNLSIEDVIYKLAAEVKRSRAMGNKLHINTLIGRLGLITNYGKFDQRFPVDSSHQIILRDEIEKLHRTIQDAKRVVVVGNPGSGKSWLVDEYIEKLKNETNKVIHYNCFHSLQDKNSLDRIRVTSLYGNLVSQIIEQCPELLKYKNTTFGADKVELENLLRLIDKEFYLIVDGLDHISREYELHKNQLSSSDVEIVSELLKIHFPENSYVLISSQPIDELKTFKDSGYSIFEIEPWRIEHAKSLMETFQIDDGEIEEENVSSISAYLIKKSQGNALYLNYILRQLRNTDITKEIIDEIPDYDIGLSEYYSYLYTMVRNNRTINALCGADFYLNLDELEDITGDGEYVEQDISILHPLLVENKLNGGFSIYHESFRRFVLSLLKKKKVDIVRNVYGLITDWLQKKPFFEFEKAFYYLTELQYMINRDNDNVSLIEKDFILKSVSEGYSRKHIRMNLNYIIRSAGRIKNMFALTTASALLEMLDDLNEFESTGEEYFKAICDIKGASRLNQLMQLDGKPTFDKVTGKMACYISSKSGVTPWWKLYLDTETKQYGMEDYKYYLRYYLDEYGISIISNIMEMVETENSQIRNQVIEIAYNEIKDYIEIVEIFSIAEKKQLTCWINYLLYLKNGYYPQHDISIEIAIENWEKIKNIKTPRTEDAVIFEELFSQVYYFVEQGDRRLVEIIMRECENKNWYYNWIIYSVKMAELCAYATQMDSQSICQTALINLEFLVQDTEVFKGNPRTCDLYSLQDELTKSYERAIELISKFGTLQDLKKALNIFKKLDDETGTILDHCMNGPLTDLEFLKLMSRFLTVDNYEIMKPYLIKTQEKIEKNEVYDSVAEAKLRFVSIISKYNYIEASEYFDTCVQYLVAYGFHKDIILYQIMDSYEVFFEAVEVNPIEERDIITKMTIALWNHTDGRVTKHFLNKWFDKLLVTDEKHALSLLSGLQIKQGRSWIIDRMLCSVIEKYCNDFSCLNVVISMIESLPNDTSPRIIDAATSAFKVLSNVYKKTSGNEKLVIKSHMNELVTNIVSRFNILGTTKEVSNSWEDKSIKEFLLEVESKGYDVSQYVEYFNIQKNYDLDNAQLKNMRNAFKNSQPRFAALTLDDAKKWFETNKLIERDIPDICKFLKNYQNDRKNLLEMFRVIINRIGEWNYSLEQKNLVLQIVEQLKLNDNELSEVHMLLYLCSYEWGSSLIDADELYTSIELNYEVSREIFYRELPEIIISRSGRITKGLLNGLSTIKYDKNNIVMIWKSAFEIMKLRFPNLDQYPIDFCLEETEKLLGLRNNLLLRFTDGGKEQFLAAYAYLANAAEEKKYSEFTESIIFCLEQYNHYNLVTKISIVDLIKCYGNQLDSSNKKRMINAINAVYPTGNLLLDVLFSEFTIYKNFLVRCSDKRAPNLMNQENIKYYLEENMYDLGKTENRQGIEEYAKNSIYCDSVMNVVNACGINYVELYKKLHISKKLNNLIRIFVSASSKIPEKNTVYKSYVIQYALHEIIKKVYYENKPELILQYLLRLMPDYQGMYRLFKCREIQPRNHLYDQENSCTPFLEDNEKEYLLIARFEKKENIDYHHVSLLLGYQGIIEESNKKNIIPFSEYLVMTINKGRGVLISDNLESLIALNKTLDCELENENYLWIERKISKLLKIQTEFDYLNGRYIGINQKGDIVFIMKIWSSSYLDNSDYYGNAIPLYTGSELYIKREYLHVLEQKFGKFKVKTYVQAFSQNY